MSQLVDFIKKQVAEAASGNLSIPENLKEQVMGGVSDSIFDSLKQTAAKEGGIGQITSLFTGGQSASASPVSALAGQLFSANVAPKLGLSPTITSAVTKLIPVVIDKLTKKSSSGDGIGLDDILSSLGGSSLGDTLKGAAGSLLGGLFK
ncbi:MAG: hypothetical protein IJ511_04730 [Bacteroides sp.]|nr:hypothetical protein [Bacteroides sp.]